jgi:hypothetical protein
LIGPKSTRRAPWQINADRLEDARWMPSVRRRGYSGCQLLG